MRLGFRGMDAEPVEPVVLRKVGVEHDQRIRLAFRPTAARIRASAGGLADEGGVQQRFPYLPVGASLLGILQLGVPPAIAATEAGAFVTGVITGFLGVSIIESLTSRLGAVR